MALIKNRWDLAESIGSGDSGTCYKAFDRVLGKNVALKRLNLSREALERLDREGEALLKLKHPHIVQVIALDADEEGPFMVMEYVSGGTLDVYMQKVDLLPDQALGMFMGIIDGLDHAHHHGILHLNIKPANTFYK